jgi:AraC-like DNA-binding protein
VSRHRRSLDTGVDTPPLVKGIGYPAERSFLVGRNTLTTRFHAVYTHPLIEIGLVVRGSGALYLNGRSHPMRAGDGYFLDMSHPHRHDPDRSLSDIYVHIKYETLEALAPRDEFTRFLRPLLLVQAGRVSPVIRRPARFGRLLRDAWQLYSSVDPYGYVLAWARVVEAFVEIGRHCERVAGRDGPASGLRGQEAVAHALHFIGANVTRPVTLTQIASHCALSPSRLSAVFSSVMHTSPIAYRNRLRIERAVEMLTSSSRTVQQIAYECGFQSLAQFRVLLKRQTGMVAHEVRSQ